MRVLGVRLPYVLIFVILICVLSGAAFVWLHSTRVQISNTAEATGIDRPGINLGGLSNYGSQQLLKSLNYVNGGYFPGTYAGATYSCSAGETTPRPRGTTASRIRRVIRQISGRAPVLWPSMRRRGPVMVPGR